MNPLSKMRVRNFFLGVGGQLGFSLYGQERQDQAQQEVYESSEHPHDGFTLIGKSNEKLKVETCRVAVTAQNRIGKEGDSVTTEVYDNAKEGIDESSSVILQTPQEAHTVIRETSQESVRTVISPSLSFTDFKNYADAGLSRLSTLNSLLTTFPPSSADIRASADVLSNLSEEDAAEIFSPFPGLLESLQLSELRRDPEQFNAVLSKATESLTKRKWADYFNKQVEVYAEVIEEQERESVVLPQDLLDSHSTWDVLTEKYNCSICQDVKAAPVVLSCEHNFCFACIEAHKNSCTQDSTSRSGHYLFEEDIVVHKCPNCQVEITQDGLYERDLDETIYQLVGKVADIDPVTGEDLTERKAEYFERREAHKNAMRIKRQQQQQKRKEEQHQQTGEQSADPESSNSTNDWYLPTIVMVALIAIMVLLKR